MTSPLNLDNLILGSFGFATIVGAMIGSDELLIGGDQDRFDSSAGAPNLVILLLLARTVSTPINSNSRDAELVSLLPWVFSDITLLIWWIHYYYYYYYY